MQTVLITCTILYAIFWIWAYFDAKNATIIEDEINI